MASMVMPPDVTQDLEGRNIANSKNEYVDVLPTRQNKFDHVARNHLLSHDASVYNLLVVRLNVLINSLFELIQFQFEKQSR